MTIKNLVCYLTLPVVSNVCEYNMYMCIGMEVIYLSGCAQRGPWQWPLSHTHKYIHLSMLRNIVCIINVG